MTKRTYLLLVVASVLLAGCARSDFKQSQTPIAKEIEAMPISKIQMFLYSLEPAGGLGYAVNTEQVFHGFTLLGKAEVTAADDKTTLLRSFARAVRESDGTVAACFNPRHGLRVIIASSTNDFVICYECLSVMVYGFNGGKGFLVTSSPNGTFNEYLDKYHLQKAKKDG